MMPTISPSPRRPTRRRRAADNRDGRSPLSSSRLRRGAKDALEQANRNRRESSSYPLSGRLRMVAVTPANNHNFLHEPSIQQSYAVPICDTMLSMKSSYKDPAEDEDISREEEHFRLRISIAMCTYNGMPFVQEQLESIAKQTRTPDELVVCDDASTDETIQEIQAFARNAPFPVQIYSSPTNVGTRRNFGRAIDLARHDIIMLSDQDDVWVPGKVARIAEIFEQRRPVGLVFTDLEIMDEHSSVTGRKMWKAVGVDNRAQQRFNDGRALDVLLKGPVVIGASMAFRSHFKNLVLPICDDGIFLHDSWIAILIASVADTACIDEPLVQYRTHSQQQLGPPDRLLSAAGIEARLGTSRDATLQRLLAYAKVYQLTHKRLLVHRQDYKSLEAVLPRLESVSAHLHARGTLPQRRTRRLPIVLRELAQLRYQRYSLGLRSAAKDLVI